MPKWNSIAELRVIRRLAEMLNRRWNLGLGFAEPDGSLLQGGRFERFATRRPLCELVQSTAAGRERCAATAAGMLEQYRAGGGCGASTYLCHAGLSEFFVPLEVEGELLGLVLAGGALCARELDSQRATIFARCDELGLGAREVESALARTTVLAPEDEQTLAELIELVVAEILVYREEMARKERRLDRLTRQLADRSSYDQIVGKSQPMQELYRLLDKISATDATVLIEGENGTGKELVARAIHFNSARAQRPFVVQNCSAFNDNLLDSELFGHSRGAFTGAVGNKKGLFEVADGGTFFLDEIGDMSPALQVKLLRILQEGTFIPVGSTREKRVDVRIIAATNRDLKQLVERGLFREDLYFRVNVIGVTLPSLRQRREDIPLLVEHFLHKHAPERQVRLSAGSLQRLLDYNWPGNVRELENEIERLLVLCSDDEVIREEFLSPRIRYEVYSPQGSGEQTALPAAIEQLERTMILDHLKRARWNKTRAAETLGISRRNLIRKVQNYGLERRRNR